MRMSRIAVAAGLVVASLGLGTAAEAQPGPRWDHGRDHGRHYDRHDNGHHYGWRNDRRRWHHPRCHTEWRHHHRVRVCR